MAYIGMGYLVASPITSETGNNIVYGDGFVIGPAVAANLTYVINDNPDFGDDVEQDNDNGINGYNGTIEATNIEDAVFARLLGWEAVGEGDALEYESNAGAPPKMGWGYIGVKRTNGVMRYEAHWFHKAQFTQPTVRNNTKTRQIEWAHPSLTVNGIAAYLGNTVTPRWFRQKTFTTAAAAMAWLDQKANITPVTT